jgi:hypothetical protein
VKRHSLFEGTVRRKWTGGVQCRQKEVRSLEGRSVIRNPEERNSTRGSAVSGAREVRLLILRKRDRETERRGVPRNFIDRGVHRSGDVAGDLGTSGLGS